MKTCFAIIQILLAGLFAGCSTSYLNNYYPGREEQAVFAIAQLYDSSRAMQYTNGIREYALVRSPDVVSACQTLLLHFSESDDDAVRLAAACRLAHFGTMPAIDRCLQLAHSEKSPEARAEIWSTIIELLRPPAKCPAPQITTIRHGGDTISTGEVYEVFQSLLTAPELNVFISCGYQRQDFVLPPELDMSRLRSEILSQYENDAGSWTIRVVDKIPFVPFSSRQRTLTLTVREAIAESLQAWAVNDRQILAAFQVFSKHADDAISGPAREVVKALTVTKEPITALR